MMRNDDAVRAAVAAESATIETALTGGDDYEIILTLAPDKLAALRVAAHSATPSPSRVCAPWWLLRPPAAALWAHGACRA